MLGWIRNAVGHQSKEQELDGDAYASALQVLEKIEALYGLAYLHREVLQGNADEGEAKALVLGAYRTVGIAGGICLAISKSRGDSKEKSSEYFWNMINKSSIRDIAGKIHGSCCPNTMPPLGNLKEELEQLVRVGNQIYNQFTSGDIEAANSTWREAAKGNY